jgi:hypothetical protein
MKNVMIYNKRSFTNVNKPDGEPIGSKDVTIYKIRKFCFCNKIFVLGSVSLLR